MKKQAHSTRQQRSQRWIEATPSDFLKWINDLEACLVVIYCRVSRRQQRKNLKQQLSRLRSELQRRGFVVVKIVKEIASGWADDREGFDHAIEIAKATGAIVVAETTCRFIRSKKYKSDRKTRPNDEEFEQLMRQAQGVTLATLYRPDLTQSQVESVQKKRGQAASSKKPGRPKLTQANTQRRAKIRRVLKLNEEGFKARDIHEKTGIPLSTVKRWIDRDLVSFRDE